MSCLKEFRENKGYTQEKVAEALGITQGAVSQWENGSSTPSVSALKKLAGLYNCTVDSLLGGVSCNEDAGHGRPQAAPTGR